MAQVTYLPGVEDPAVVEWAGVVFRANVPVSVEDAHILRKASHNRFFVVDDGVAGEPSQDAPGEADEKAALVLEAEALGIDVDRRWGITRLKSEIEAAKAAVAA